MQDARIARVPIHARDAAEVSPSTRRRSCRISADVARELGISLDHRIGDGTHHVRIGVTDDDVNLLFNPAYLEYLGKSRSFVVEGVAGGTHRVEIYANSGPGARDGGVFRLFGGGNPFAGASIPVNARVTLCREVPIQAAAI